MKLFRGVFIVFWFSAFLAIPGAFAQDEPITQIDLIFDASNSMWGQIDGKAKIEIAREAMNELLKEFEPKKNIYLGLRIYGHLNKSCDNSVLEIKPGKDNAKAIREKIAGIKPLGKTPIAYSLQMSAGDFDKNIPGKKIVILVTDGLESCGGNPCVAAGILKKAGIVSKIHVVGFGLEEGELSSLDCIAKPFNGKVIGAKNTAELISAFKEISKAVVVENNLVVKGFDGKQRPVLMDVQVLSEEKKIAQESGNNVAFSLKEGTYKVNAESQATGETLEKENITLSKSKVTTVELEFNQGYLNLKSFDSSGKEIYANYEILQKEKLIAEIEGKDKVVQALLPGEYVVKATDTNLKKDLIKNNVIIKSGEPTEAVFKFADANFMLVAIDDKSQEIYAQYTVYNSGTDKEIATNEGKGKIKIVVPPGKYDIKAFNNETKTELWQKEIELSEGLTSEKSFKFAMAEMLLSALDENGNETYTGFTILHADTEDEVKADEGSGEIKFVLPPGKYDIKAYHPDSRQETLEKNVELKSDTPFKKQFKFSTAVMLLNCVDKDGKPIYTSFTILKAGTENQVKADEGSGEIKFILPPGKYDIKAYQYDSRKEVLEKDIELKAGSEYKKQFSF